MREVVIYDTTLRDGEQMPLVRISRKDKMRIAHMLDELGVPQIEAGFPAMGRDVVNFVRDVRETVSAKVLALSRLKDEDIDLVAESNAHTILLFVASSPLHIKHKYGLSLDVLGEMVSDSIEHAVSYGLEVSFSTEDSTRTPLHDLLYFYHIAEEAGAHRIGLTDTVGIAGPSRVSEMVRVIRTSIDLPLSVHLHNDLGLATANALAGVEAGATYVGTTVNGIGERGGNVPLEEFVMALRLVHGIDPGIDTTGLVELSQLVQECTGVVIQPHKPVVGANAFTHETGIHVAAVLDCPQTYEPFSPDLIGASRRLFFGMKSGRGAVRRAISHLGLRVDLDDAYALIKNLDEPVLMEELACLLTETEVRS